MGEQLEVCRAASETRSKSADTQINIWVFNLFNNFSFVSWFTPTRYLGKQEHFKKKGRKFRYEYWNGEQRRKTLVDCSLQRTDQQLRWFYYTKWPVPFTNKSVHNTFSPASETAGSVPTPWVPASTSQQPLPPAPSVTSAGSTSLRQKQKGHHQTSASGRGPRYTADTYSKVRNITTSHASNILLGGAKTEQSKVQSPCPQGAYTLVGARQTHGIQLFTCLSFWQRGVWVMSVVLRR